MRGRRLTVISIVVAVLAVACATAEQAAPDPGLEGQSGDQDAAAEEPPHPGPTAPEEGPLDPDAEIRPDLMEVRPAQASPGEHVELHWPQETSRGVGFVLEERVDDSWQLRYFLTVPDIGEGDDLPEDLGGSWFLPDSLDQNDWPSIGLEGPGPDFAVVPEPASPGEYRICTAFQSDSFCAELTITQ